MDSLLYGFMITFGGIIGIVLAVIVSRLLWTRLLFPAAIAVVPPVVAAVAPAGTPATTTPAATPATAAVAPPVTVAATVTPTTSSRWTFGMSRFLFLLLHVAIAIVTLVLVLTYSTWILWFTESSDGVNLNPLTWRPSVGQLLTLLVMALVFLWLAPKPAWEWPKLLIAILGAAYIVYFIIALVNTGIGVSIMRDISEYNECLRDPKCAATPAKPQATQQDTRLQSVKIVECRLGWSRVVPVRGHSGTVYWNWRVRANYLRNKQWYEHIPDTNVDADAFRYCHDGELAGKDMPLDWR